MPKPFLADAKMEIARRRLEEVVVNRCGAAAVEEARRLAKGP